MAQTIKLKRSNTAGNLPTTTDLALGEVAINTKDGKFFLRKHVDGTDSGDAITAYAPQGINTYGTQTFEVKVITKTSAHPQFGTGSSSGYSIDGLESPFIVLIPGNTYKFDQADSSNSSHPLAFYLEEDKTTSYTTGVTTNGTPGSSGAYTQIVVSTSTPQVLYYQCSSHAYMGSGAYALSDAIADGKVDTSQLAANAVTSAKIAANSVDSSELVTGSIDTIHLASAVVTSAKIAANTIATGNIADNAVDGTKIASNSILTRHIDDNQIGIDQLNVTDGTSGQALTTDGAGTLSFSTVASSLSGASDTSITSPSSGQILVYDGTDSFDNVSISGDATLASNGALTIATNAITSTMIAQNSILTKHIDDNQIGIDQLNVTDGTSGQVLTTDGAGTLSFSTVSSGSQNAFTTISVSGQSDVVADSSTDTLTFAAGTGITLTTNATSDTITITGTTGLSANSVTATEIATGAVGSSELAATTVTAGSYTNADITVDADGRITSASNGTASVADGSITTAKLADDAVTADKLADTSVSAGTYGSATASPQITVDAQGRLTSVSNVTISSSGGSGGVGLNQSVATYEATGDGSTTAFDTGTTINSEDQTWIFIDGVYQEKGTYSTSGSTVTFSTAPPNGVSVEITNLANLTTGGAFSHSSFSGDGSTTAFTLPKAPDSETDLIVFVDGVYQNNDSFSVSSTTLTFDTAPANGTTVIVYTIGGVVTGKTYLVDTFNGDASTTAFTLSIDPVDEKNTMVYVEGVYQPKGTYSVSGTTLTFSEAPPSGTGNVEVNIGQVTTTTSVGANAVTSASIAANAVGSAEIAANSVDSSELVTGSIDTIHIGDDQVTNAKLAVNSVTNVEIAGNAVTSVQIAANQVGISELNVSDGTNGQVLTTNGSGTLSFGDIPAGYTDSDVETYLNTSDIYTDPTNNRLGIGESSPITPLHVKMATGKNILFQDALSSAALKFTTDAGAGYAAGTINASSLAINGDSTGWVSINNSSRSSGGFEHLAVDGWITSFDGSTIALFGASGTQTYSGSFSNHTHVIRTNNTDQVRIDASGNVGINGTPTAKLAVVNNSNDATYTVKQYATFGTGSTWLDSDVVNQHGGGIGEVQITNGEASRPAVLSLGGTLATGELMGAISFFRSSNTDGYRQRASIFSTVNTTGTANQHGGDLRFTTAADGGGNPLERMRIHSTGDVTINSDGSKSALDGVTGIGVQIGNASSSAAGLAFQTSNRGYMWYLSGTNFDLWDSNANVERLRINSSGTLSSGTGTGSGARGNNIINWTARNWIGITGDLPGYTNGDYPVLKTPYDYMYISVNGSYSAYIQGNGTYTTNSDERLKTNITTLPTGQLDKIANLRGVNFEWLDTNRGEGQQLGVIAQEIESEYPELVTEGVEDIKGVNYAGLVVPLIEAVKELKTKLETAEARITELENN